MNKGPHSAGQKNGNSVGVKYRGIHPSMIGYIDMTVCGNSDPGTLTAQWCALYYFNCGELSLGINY